MQQAPISVLKVRSMADRTQIFRRLKDTIRNDDDLPTSYSKEYCAKKKDSHYSEGLPNESSNSPKMVKSAGINRLHQ